MRDNSVVYSKNISILIRLAPMLILMVFYFLTIIFFEFGPQKWPVPNKFKLYSYLLIAYSLMFTGYLFSVRNKKVLVKKDNTHIFKLFLVLFIIILPLTAYGRIGTLVPNLFNGQLDFGEAYYDSQKFRTAWPEYFRIILSPALYAVIPLGIYLWNKLTRGVKITYIIGVIYYLSIDVSRGTNKSIAEIILILIMFGLLKLSIKSISSFADNRRKKLINIKGFRRKIIAVLGCLTLLVGFLNMFTLFISSRTTSLFNKFTGAYIDLDNILLSFLVTEDQKFGLAVFMSYLSQGYYGLALALEKPFYFTAGVGYSTFLSRNFDSLGLGQMEFKTYAYRLLEDNWPTGQVWSSFFIWPASDLTFYGVLVLMIIIGYILGSTWISSLIANDYVSVIVFSLLCILCFYVPMNNQLFQSGEFFICTWFWLFVWLKNKWGIRFQ